MDPEEIESSIEEAIQILKSPFRTNENIQLLEKYLSCLEDFKKYTADFTSPAMVYQLCRTMTYR